MGSDNPNEAITKVFDLKNFIIEEIDDNSMYIDGIYGVIDRFSTEIVQTNNNFCTFI